jgi:hypothetical protein
MKIFILLLTVCASWSARAQTTNGPWSYFDSYKSAIDTPLIRGMSSIGVVKGQVTYPVDIWIERLNVRPTTNTSYAVALRTHLAQGALHVDYIDYDELAGLLHGLKLMAQAGHAVVPMDDFEVVYRLRGGASVAKVSNGNNIVIAIKCGDANGTRNQLAPYVLDDLQRLLAEAKAKIESIAASGQ